MYVFDSLTTRLTFCISAATLYITKTAIPFSVCLALHFYNATFAEFSYRPTTVRRACNNYYKTTSSVKLPLHFVRWCHMLNVTHRHAFVSES